MTTFPHYLTTLDTLPLDNLFFPAELPSDRLMIILHGRGGKADDFTWIVERFGFDHMHYLFLNAPTSYEDGYSWYKDIPHQDEGIFHSSTLLTQTFDILFEKDFNPSQSFLLGFSQGALLTFEFGARYPKALAAYFSISGHLNNPTHLLHQMPPTLKTASWYCTHGTQDLALDFKTAKEQITLLKDAGIDIIFKPYIKAHEIIEEEIEMIKKWIRAVP